MSRVSRPQPPTREDLQALADQLNDPEYVRSIKSRGREHDDVVAHRLLVQIQPDSTWLSANARLNWREKNRRTQWLRQLARAQAAHQGIPANLPVPVEVVAYVTTPSRRREDPNNANPTTKALIDGLTDHYCWADDDHEHVLGPDHRRGPLTPGHRFIVLDLIPVPGAVRPVRACRRCHCTQTTPCEPLACWWVQFDLCSTCVTPDDIPPRRR